MKWLTVHVGGQKWSVHLVGRRSKKLDSEKEFADGATYVQDCAIYVAKDTEEQAREDVLLHELLHAVFYVSGAYHELDVMAPDGATRDAAEERIIRCVTPVLHRLLKDLGFQFPKGP